MKTLLSAMALTLLSQAAIAETQAVTCVEINKSGSRKANGGSLRAEFNLNQDGTLSRRAPGAIDLKGFFKRGAAVGTHITEFHADQAAPRGDVQYTNVNWYDSVNELMEMQLQFKQRILGADFRDVHATLVVGFEENSSEPMPSWGYDLECDSRVK